MTGTPTILKKIIARKWEEVAERSVKSSLSSLEERARDSEPCRGFAEAMINTARVRPAVIAEAKRASPSKGVIREDFDPLAIAEKLL